jgi:hypothetical protein
MSTKQLPRTVDSNEGWTCYRRYKVGAALVSPFAAAEGLLVGLSAGKRGYELQEFWQKSGQEEWANGAG